MSTYEPCVLGSDGNCTRWSHDHAADRPSVTPRVGDTITTAEQLDALPVGSIFLSPFDAVWRRVEESESQGGYRFESIEYDGRHQAETFARFSEFPLTVLYVPGEQPRPPVTDNARAEQSEMLVDAAAIPTALLAVGRAETTTEEWPRCKASRDGGCDRCHDEHGRHIPCRAETTTATTEDAEEVLHGAGWFARADLDPRDLRGILHDLADADLLATARTRPTREELSTLILSFLKPPKHSGGSWTLNPDDAADAVLALFRGGDK